jgi:hypothetical protein
VSQHHIALMVDEPIAGHFYWMLLRQQDAEHHPEVVECSPGPLPGYAPAMMAGIAALQRRVDARGEGGEGGDGAVPAVAAYLAPAGRSRHH